MLKNGVLMKCIETILLKRKLDDKIYAVGLRNI